MIPTQVQKIKSYDSEAESPIFKKIKQIQDLKVSIMLQVTTHFEEVRKKLIKSLEKAEKNIQQRLNEACWGTLDALRKVNELADITSFEQFTFERKSDRVIRFLKKISLEGVLQKVTQKFRIIIEDIKKQKETVFESFPQFNLESNLIQFENKLKVEGNQPVEKLVEINGKILKIGAKSANIDKHFLNKKVDLAMTVKISKGKESEKDKKKNYLFMLHDQQLTFYNDKLVLHSLKKFEYNCEEEIKGVQIGKYLLIAEKNKITRINVNNIEEMMVKIFSENITAICSDMYLDGIVIAYGTKVSVCDPESLQVFYGFQYADPVRYLRKVGDFLIALTDISVEIAHKFRQHSSLSKPGLLPLKILPIGDVDFILITKQSRFIYYELDEDGDGSENSYETLGSFSTKGIKDVQVGGSYIYCLAVDGKNILLYTF